MVRRKKLSPEPFDVEITSLLDNGRGAAIYEEKPLQVYDALAGEKVQAKFLFGRNFRGRAQTLDVSNPSALRAEPRCPHFGVCSACTLQHLEHHAQLEFKQQLMLTHLLENGNVAPESILPPLSADRWNYRRKARLSVRYVKAKGRVLVGFRERDGRFVADMNECHVLTRTVADQLPALSLLIASLDAVETIPQIEVTSGDKTSALIFRHLEPLSEPDLEALRVFANKSGLAVLLQSKGPETVRPLDDVPVDLTYALPEFDVDFEFEPLDFVQVNGSLNQAMIRQAIDMLAPLEDKDVLDLFCGLGNFSLPLARSCRSVTGVEGDEGLVKRAMANAKRNGLDNANFVRADLYSDDFNLEMIGGRFSRVLLDPPRSGAEQVLPWVAASGASRVVYVSCNPKTLGRDAGLLVNVHGFKLCAAGVMDMFPHTTHIESMAVFERKRD